MGKGVLLATALFLLSSVGAARAQESEQEVSNLVFVGRLVAIEEMPDPCEGKGDCISMDVLYKARYEIMQTIEGSYPEHEISFGIADHYGFPAMAKFQHALLFVGLYANGPWLHKYQGFAVHPLSDGQWGYCGGPFRPTEGEPHPPKPRPLPFARDFGVVGEWSTEGLQQVFDPETYSVEDGRIRCKQGLALSDLYETIRKGALQARGVKLPTWAETKVP